MRDGVLLVACVIDVSAQERGVEQIGDTKAVAVDLVLIRGADAAARGADGLAAGCGLGGELDHAVVREDDLRAVGDEELLLFGTVGGKAGVLEFFDLVEEGCGVEHDAVADDALAAGTQNAAGDELQDELLAADDDGVAGVVTAGVAGDDVELFAEDVDDLAFAFVAPLGAENDGRLLFVHEERALRRMGSRALQRRHAHDSLYLPPLECACELCFRIP